VWEKLHLNRCSAKIRHKEDFQDPFQLYFSMNIGLYNIKMNLREIGWDGMNRMDLAQDRDQWRALVNTVMKEECPLLGCGVE
jgi:hypothetical protein